MNRTMFVAAILFLSALLQISCGPSLTDITTSLIEQGRNDEALARMRRALVLNPQETDYHRLMGIALYNKREYRDAITAFEKVLKNDDEDDQAAYYMAASYENLKDYDHAIQYYRLYNELTFYGEFKDIVAARIKILYRQQLEQEAQQALKMEQQLDVSKVPLNTVAILYFENKGKKTELNPLQKGLAEMLITDLSKVKALKVVERLRLQKLIEEMNLGESDLVDQKTAPRLGKLLGAYRLLKGSFFELKENTLNIDAFVAQTKTGELDVTTNITGDMRDFFRLEKNLIFKILDEMKIKLSDSEREAILEIPTENYFAFLQYSRGLDFEDRGMYAQAYDAYSQAAKADPNFNQAKTSAVTAQKADQLVGSSSSQTQSSGDQKQSSTSNTMSNTPGAIPASNPLNRPGGGSIIDRLGSIGNNFNNNLNPGSGNQTPTPPNIRSPLPMPPAPPGK
ncbi:MAG: CsgG/HfaB family protein [Bacteroidota bacterium]|nr:CsgG/HfaB family protein [Bacteroidota bacterium]